MYPEIKRPLLAQFYPKGLASRLAIIRMKVNTYVHLNRSFRWPKYVIS